MFEGKLMGIVATNALELGVDIGSLDAVITMGFPHQLANLGSVESIKLGAHAL
jgi:DEAD/DEAH box helicase domain-containing protein